MPSLDQQITLNGQNGTIIGLSPQTGKVWILLDNGIRVWSLATSVKPI